MNIDWFKLMIWVGAFSVCVLAWVTILQILGVIR